MFEDWCGPGREVAVIGLGKSGVDVFLGDGRFTGPDTLEVGVKTLRFRKAVIATGARPAIPGIPGLTEVGFLTNESVFSLTRRPDRLAVLGGGPIGIELAQAFAQLVQHEAPVELGVTLVDVVGGDFERRHIQNADASSPLYI